MGNLEREYMINNLELNKVKLGKLTRKVILVGGNNQYTSYWRM